MSDNRKFESVLVYKAKDQVVPEVMFKKLLDLGYNSCVGAAAVDAEGDFLIENIVEEKDITVEALNTMVEDTKDLEVMLHFGKYPEVFMPDDDVQPHVVVRGDNSEPIVLAFMQGDFSEWADPEDNSQRSDEYFAVQTKMVELVGRFYDRAGQDLDEFGETIMNDRKTHMAIRSIISDGGGVIVLMTTKGKMVAFSTVDDFHNKFDWGWVTKNFEYQEIEHPEPVAEEPVKKKRSFFRKDTPAVAEASVPDATSSTPPKQEELKEHFKEAIASGKTSTAIPTPIVTKQVTIPSHLSQQDRKKWIRNQQRMAGMPNHKDLPRGWQGAKYIVIPKDPMNKSMESLPTLVEKQEHVEKSLTKKSRIAPSPKTTPPSTITKPEAAPVILQKEVVAKLTSEFLPAIKSKMLDVNNNEVMNPTKLQELERDYVKFTESIGAKDVREFLNLSVEDIEKMGNLRAVAAYAFELNSYIIELLAELGKNVDKTQAHSKAA